METTLEIIERVLSEMTKETDWKVELLFRVNKFAEISDRYHEWWFAYKYELEDAVIDAKEQLCLRIYLIQPFKVYRGTLSNEYKEETIKATLARIKEVITIPYGTEAKEKINLDVLSLIKNKYIR